jgi:molybdopterin-guanine dinucleotide biosynthesis protein A
MKAVIFAKPSERLPGKHLMDICGQPMIKMIYNIFVDSSFFEDVVIYSKYESLDISGVNIVKDHSKGTIIDSLISALREFKEFFAVAGDIPLVDREIIEKIMIKYNGFPIAPINTDGIIEPLFAIYNNSILDEMVTHSQKDKRIFSFLERKFILVRLEPIDSVKLYNINTLQDYIDAKKKIRC